MLASFARSSRWTCALHLFAEMHDLSLEGSAPIYGSTVLACASSWKWRWAIWLLCNLSKSAVFPDATSRVAALSAFEASAQWHICAGTLHDIGSTKAALLHGDSEKHEIGNGGGGDFSTVGKMLWAHGVLHSWSRLVL